MTSRLSILPTFILLLLLVCTPASCHLSRLGRAHARLHRLHHLIHRLQALNRAEPIDNTINSQSLYTPYIRPIENWTSFQPITNNGNGLFIPAQNGNPNPATINNWSNNQQTQPIVDPNDISVGSVPQFVNNWSYNPGTQNAPIGSIGSPITTVGNDVYTPAAQTIDSFNNNWSKNNPVQTSPIDIQPITNINNNIPVGSIPDLGNNWTYNPDTQTSPITNPIDNTNLATPFTNNWTFNPNSPPQTSPATLPITSSFAPFTTPAQGEQTLNPTYYGQDDVNDIPSQNVPIDPSVAQSVAAQNTQLGASNPQPPSDLAAESYAAQQGQGPITTLITSNESHQALEQLAEQHAETNGQGYVI